MYTVIKNIRIGDSFETQSAFVCDECNKYTSHVIYWKNSSICQTCLNNMMQSINKKVLDECKKGRQQ